MEIAAGQFKATCLKLMDMIKISHETVTITKRGVPVARLVPVTEAASSSLFGFLKDSVVVQEDIVKPIDEKWNADE
jgi:prevent-host-death family protein